MTRTWDGVRPLHLTKRDLISFIMEQKHDEPLWRPNVICQCIAEKYGVEAETLQVEYYSLAVSQCNTPFRVTLDTVARTLLDLASRCNTNSYGELQQRVVRDGLNYGEFHVRDLISFITSQPADRKCYGALQDFAGDGAYVGYVSYQKHGASYRCTQEGECYGITNYAYMTANTYGDLQQHLAKNYGQGCLFAESSGNCS